MQLTKSFVNYFPWCFHKVDNFVVELIGPTGLKIGATGRSEASQWQPPTRPAASRKLPPSPQLTLVWVFVFVFAELKPSK